MIEMRVLELCPLADLQEDARWEIQQYLRQQRTENRCCFEVFRRAIVLCDEQAWFAVYRLYENLVGSWVLRFGATMHLTEDDVVLLINSAFAKFARSLSPAKFADFPKIEALLGYLKRCAQSVVIDARRVQPLNEVRLEDVEQELLVDDSAELVVARLDGQMVWPLLDRVVADQTDRLLLYLLYRCDLSPAMIQKRYPVLFPTIEVVYRLKRNLLERLRRNDELQLFAGRRVSA